MDFKFDRDYPPEFEHLRDMVNEAKDHIKAIDEYLNYILDEKDGPFSEYNLWRAGLSHSERKDRLVSFLEEKRRDYRLNTLAKIEQEIADIDPKVAQWIRQSASFGMESYPQKDGRYAGKKQRPSPKSDAIDPTEMDMLLPSGPALNGSDEFLSENWKRIYQQTENAEQNELMNKLEQVLLLDNPLNTDAIKKLMQDVKKRRLEKQHPRRGHKR